MDGLELSCDETVDWLLEDSDGEAVFAWVEGSHDFFFIPFLSSFSSP